MVNPRKPSSFLSHGTISHSISSVNSASEFGFRWTTTLRATTVNLPGVGLASLPVRSQPRRHRTCGSAFQHSSVALVRRGWLASSECNGDIGSVHPHAEVTLKRCSSGAVSGFPSGLRDLGIGEPCRNKSHHKNSECNAFSHQMAFYSFVVVEKSPYHSLRVNECKRLITSTNQSDPPTHFVVIEFL